MRNNCTFYLDYRYELNFNCPQFKNECDTDKKKLLTYTIYCILNHVSTRKVKLIYCQSPCSQ